MFLLNNSKYVNLMNVFLRLLNIFLKGIFLIIAARYLTVESIGIIGTLFAYITLIVFFLGFEYWYYSNRLIKDQNDLKVIINQFFLYVIIYIIFIPIIYTVFQIKYSLGLEISIIVLSLHLTQETSRILIFINKQLTASILSIITQSLWTIPIFIIWLLGFVISLNNIFLIYSVFALTGAIVNIIFLTKYFSINIKELKKYIALLDYSLISRGIKLTMLILLSTLSIKASELMGRFILERQDMLVEAGVYTFYQSIVSILYLLLYHGVSSFYLPKLNKCDLNSEAYIFIKEKYKKTFIISLILGTLLILFFGTLLIYFFIKDVSYIENIICFYIMCVGGFLYTSSTYLGILIYVNRIDSITIKINFISVFIAFIALYVGLKSVKNALLGISLGYVFWSLLILLLNVYNCRKHALI
jgi:O-antigen/teichoic acid export membrane protein